MSVTNVNSNSIAHLESVKIETNVVAHLATEMSATNSVATTNAPDSGTNFPISTMEAATNIAMSVTNKDPMIQVESATNLTATNSATVTNSADLGTNVLISTNAVGTNATARPKSKKKTASAAPMPEMAGMNSNPSASSAKRGADLPPAMQTRISRIVDSEILGPVVRPLPMALLGIAGEYAFLRSASGQTGLVKEGDSLGDIKLLRIGINRALIEQDGQKKELTIFSGYGGDSLLPTQKDTPDENNQP
jgi:hypothetical protein